MSFTFSFTPEARQELLEAIQYYEFESPGLGAAFFSTVNEGIDQLLEFPESAPVLHGKVRRKPLRRFPYSLPLLASRAARPHPGRHEPEAETLLLAGSKIEVALPRSSLSISTSLVRRLVKAAGWAGAWIG